MMTFINDEATVIPLRLATREGLQGFRDRGGFTHQVDVDEHVTGYVDIDDLLASSDLGLQTSLIHLLRERQAPPNYAQRMRIASGPASLMTPSAEFDRAHARGIASELALLRDFFGDLDTARGSGFGKPDESRYGGRDFGDRWGQNGYLFDVDAGGRSDWHGSHLMGLGFTVGDGGQLRNIRTTY
jgi:hypothetical protein